MPAKSKAQQKAAGAALAAKRGEADKKDLKGASRDMVESMTEKELEELASTRRKGLPEKMGWMPLSPTASQCAKLVVLDSQGKREGIHEGSYHNRDRSRKERVPVARGGGGRVCGFPQEAVEATIHPLHDRASPL